MLCSMLIKFSVIFLKIILIVVIIPHINSEFSIAGISIKINFIASLNSLIKIMHKLVHIGNSNIII